MIVKRFKANNFRNIESCDISFSPGINLLHGKNAEGKTNALEGIYIFSRGKSFRSCEERDLIKNGEDGFNLFLEYEDAVGKGTLEYSLYGQSRLRKKNGYKIKKITEMVGSFKTVLFSPDDLSIVKDGPDERRAFINIAAAQCYPEYIDFYSGYKKALENRNCILKNAKAGLYFNKEELLAWSGTMAGYAAHIHYLRKEYIDKLSKYTSLYQSEISGGKEELTLYYKSHVEDGIKEVEEIKERYEALLSGNLEKELSAGTSLYGVHRDELEIEINGISARSFASQGQQRSAVLSLKLSEGEVNREICGEYPVYLLDDVLSELDNKRKEFIINGIKEKQVIITSCENGEDMKFADTVFEVEGGRYVFAHR